MSPRSTCDGEGGRGGEERTKHVCENLFKTRRNHPGRARRADVARRGRGRAARASRTHQLGLHGSRRHLSPFARPRASRGSRTLSPVRGRSSRCSLRPRPSRRSRVRLSPGSARVRAGGVESRRSRRRGRTLASRGTKTRRAGVSPGEQKDVPFTVRRVASLPARFHVPESCVLYERRTSRGSATLYWRVARIRSTPLLLSSPPARRSAVNSLPRVSRDVRPVASSSARAGSRLGMVASGRSDALSFTRSAVGALAQLLAVGWVVSVALTLTSGSALANLPAAVLGVYALRVLAQVRLDARWDATTRRLSLSVTRVAPGDPADPSAGSFVAPANGAREGSAAKRAPVPGAASPHPSRDVPSSSPAPPPLHPADREAELRDLLRRHDPPPAMPIPPRTASSARGPASATTSSATSSYTSGTAASPATSASRTTSRVSSTPPSSSSPTARAAPTSTASSSASSRTFSRRNSNTSETRGTRAEAWTPTCASRPPPPTAPSPHNSENAEGYIRA